MTDNAHHFILGGQKSGKSRRAESAAADWLAGASGRRAVLIATAQAWDAEMTRRIARHRLDRAERVPGLETVEEPLRLPELIGALSRPDTLLVVDCLTLWLTNLLMPPELDPQRAALPDWRTEALLLVEALSLAPGPVVLVGNEIGLGVIPLGEETRAFVDALGQLNQHVAASCGRVTLMVAGLPLTVKDNA
ncbi:bifunctional adenosylcobinamide kinase/adenosylcobinamide-phosphate guanylyltransferase [Pseudacidovorax sp. RU35E]|uniref:bifunctional adenosylcobinamide kinase/adenosylcobinamide-phosphate guanylyltransferase n=1 Tax=Pseudacidovorax sp. RU35E TaxID=1907403 RepID=UPI0009553F91|nr:bifunctional adenosylcobinamide kinase/adenosylcobinamide-phosphate guanylyltransferase [Pseudacidovorax sp. RU35E]SIP97690.1 adenosylcobinamide kinase /adenosylcobinamide-phosphate guanylyltransferase [Pseudacidovorax sp. RU35E]